MELFGSFAFFGGALFGGLGLLLYRALGLPRRLGYRHLIGALCLAVWLAVFWTRPYQPLGLLAVASAALWAMRRGYLPTWAAVLLTMAPLLPFAARQRPRPGLPADAAGRADVPLAQLPGRPEARL